jgi:hypothetical protein
VIRSAKRFRPAVPGRPGEDHQLVFGRCDQGVRGPPAFKQPQERGRPGVVAGDRQVGREGFEPVGARAVEHSPFVPGGSFIVAGDGPRLARDLTVKQLAQPLEADQACRPVTWAPSVSVPFVAAHAHGRSSQD